MFVRNSFLSEALSDMFKLFLFKISVIWWRDKKNCGTTPPLPLYAFMAWTFTSLIAT